MLVHQRADLALPELYKAEIRLTHLAWTFGSITRLESLTFLCMMARYFNGDVFEFGTFRGRTTYNLALNTAGTVHTIDNASNAYGGYVPGELFIGKQPDIDLRIGDSRTVDISDLHHKMSLVLVDGGHDTETVESDTDKAWQLVKYINEDSAGIIVWDDYDLTWPAVVDVIHRLDRFEPLVYFQQEALVVWWPQLYRELEKTI